MNKGTSARMHVRMLLMLTMLVTLHQAVGVKTTVPVLLWSSQLKPTSNSESSYTEQIDASDVNKYLNPNNNIPVVVFVQDQLSVEHFTLDPSPYISNIFDDSNNNPMLFTNVKNTKNIYSKLEEESNGRVIDLPENNLVSNEEVIKSYVDQYNQNGSAIFVLTGKTNNYLSHPIRKRAADDKAPILVQDNACFLLYTKLVSLEVPEYSKKHDQVENPVVKCDKEMAQSFELNFPESVKVEAQIGTAINAWTIKSMKVTVAGKSYETKEELQVLSGYSYSCGNLTVDLYDKSDAKDIKKVGLLSFTRFQLQPFNKNKGSFVESSDCSVWFTIPIWMSLIVILILLTILYSGVSALMSITTPDRFENPKNRPLIITNFDE